MRHPPYHLRVNKAIDRFLLVEIIDILKEYCEISDYTYYGFGGPFLEDCRLIHNHWPEIKIVSIEKNEHTFKRQEFHRFSKNLDLKRMDFASFLADFSSDGKEIFWLDYTDLRFGHFDEFMSILGKVSENSIVKITVRAEPPPNGLYAWEKFQREYEAESTSNGVAVWENFLREYEAESTSKSAWENFLREYEQVLPPSAQQTAIETRFRFVKLLQDMFQMASQQALPASGERVFQLLDSAHYNDQTEMLSITGMVCNKNDVSKIRRWFKNWAFRNLDWKAPRKIDVPTLSAKERLHLEKYLPTETKTGRRSLARALGYRIDNSDQKHLEKLKQYEEFYQYYPYFARISL